MAGVAVTASPSSDRRRISSPLSESLTPPSSMLLLIICCASTGAATAPAASAKAPNAILFSFRIVRELCLAGGGCAMTPGFSAPKERIRRDRLAVDFHGQRPPGRRGGALGAADAG